MAGASWSEFIGALACRQMPVSPETSEESIELIQGED
jgi:hypothetical protein